MRRRTFITMTGATAVSCVLLRASRAQQAVPVIAILGSGAAEADSSKTQMELLRAGMRDSGLVEGKDYIFETRWAGSDSSRFPALAAGLLALRPAAVVASTNLAVTTLQNLSRTVPIVGTSLNAPLAVGLVASLSHPGGNITGVSTMAEELVFKLIEVMRELLPKTRNVMIMFNPTNSSNPVMLDSVQRQFANSDLVIGSVAVRSPADLDAAFSEVSRQHPSVLIVLTDNPRSKRSVPRHRALAEKNSRRHRARRHPRRAADQIHPRHQSKNRQHARHRYSADADRPRRRGDRIDP
jgi:putative tryptophan/tyrosine transport system substrate-binding protein